jgi:hypothetical protein
MVSRTDVLILFAQGPAVANSTLSNINTIVDTISKAVTAIAVIIGGIWAYFKFVRGRTYRPRLEVDTAGKWWLMNEKWLLQARVIVKNVGASKVVLPQKGTGLRVSVPADDQPPPPARTVWAKKKVFVILKDHEWIESGETISDDLLLELGVSGTCPALLEARLIAHRQTGNVEFIAREIVPAGTPLNEVKRDEGTGANARHGPNSVLAQESPKAPIAERRGRGRDRPMGER